MTDEERQHLQAICKQAAKDILRDYPADLLQWRGKTTKPKRKAKSSTLNKSPNVGTPHGS